MAPKAMNVMKAMKAKGGAKGGAMKPMKAVGGKGGAKGKDRDKDTGIKVNDMGKNNGALPAPSLPAIPEDFSDCNRNINKYDKKNILTLSQNNHEIVRNSMQDMMEYYDRAREENRSWVSTGQPSQADIDSCWHRVRLARIRNAESEMRVLMENERHQGGDSDWMVHLQIELQVNRHLVYDSVTARTL